MKLNPMSRTAVTLVVDISTPGNQVRYAAPTVDITKDIVTLYDKTYPLGIK
jgi:hypothetical protein